MSQAEVIILQPHPQEVSAHTSDAVYELEESEGIEIIGVRDGGLVDCLVDKDLIDFEEVPVKKEWVASLAEQMRMMSDKDGGTGQQTPIMLGQIRGESKLKIMDGFHREAALRQLGAERVYATVKQVDWNELYDFRIFTAKDHTQVRFSRVVHWIREVWEHSGLSDAMSVQQAFVLYRFDLNGKKHGFSVEQVELAKAWIAKKEEQWQTKALTILGHLRVAETVDPDLVHSTRPKKSVQKLEAPSQTMLNHFSKLIPNRYDLQNLVNEIAIAQNLNGPAVKVLCSKVAEIGDIVEAEKYIEGINWESWGARYNGSSKRSLRRAYDMRYKGADALATAISAVDDATRRLEMTIERGEEINDEMAEKLLEAKQAAEEMVGKLTKMGSVIVRAMTGSEEEPLQTYDISTGSLSKDTNAGLQRIVNALHSGVKVTDKSLVQLLFTEDTDKVLDPYQRKLLARIKKGLFYLQGSNGERVVRLGTVEDSRYEIVARPRRRHSGDRG